MNTEQFRSTPHRLPHELLRRDVRPIAGRKEHVHLVDLAHRMAMNLADEALLVAEPRVDRADRNTRALAYLLDSQQFEPAILE